MLTLTAIQQSMLSRQDVDIVALVTITQGLDTIYLASSSFNLASMGTVYSKYVQNVIDVTPVSIRVDPIQRRVQTSEISVTVIDDGFLANAGAQMALGGATMSVRFAPLLAMDSGDVNIPLWSGYVYDLVDVDGKTEIRGRDVLLLSEESTFYGMVVGLHPLEAMEAVMLDAGVPSASIDATSFDPTADTEISHFNTPDLGTLCVVHTDAGDSVYAQQGAGNTPSNDTYNEYWTYDRGVANNSMTDSQYGRKSKVMIDDLALCLYGSVLADEFGIVKFKRFDKTASPVATFNDSNTISISQAKSFDGMINEVHTTLGRGAYERNYVFRDNASVTAHGKNRQHKLALPYAGAAFELTSLSPSTHNTYGITSSQTNDFAVGGISGFAGFPGTRVSNSFKGVTSPGWSGPWTQPANAAASASRPIYLSLDSEILKVTSLSITSGFGANNYRWEDVDSRGEFPSPKTYSFFPQSAEVLTSTRGFGGTTPVAHEGGTTISRVFYDLTIGRHVASAIVERCANGLPVIEVETSPEHYAVQIGDFVAVETESFIWRGKVLVPGNTYTWEVTGKESDLVGDSSVIRFELTYAYNASPPWSHSFEDDPYAPDVKSGYKPVDGFGWYNTADYTSDAKGGGNSVKFESDLYDHGAGWNGLNGFIVQTGGLYMIVCQVSIDNLFLNRYAELRVEEHVSVPSTLVIPHGRDLAVGGDWSRNDHVLSVSTVRPLNRGSVIHVLLETNDIETPPAGGGVTVFGGADNTFLNIFRVG